MEVDKLRSTSDSDTTACGAFGAVAGSAICARYGRFRRFLAGSAGGPAGSAGGSGRFLPAAVPPPSGWLVFCSWCLQWHAHIDRMRSSRAGQAARMGNLAECSQPQRSTGFRCGRHPQRNRGRGGQGALNCKFSERRLQLALRRKTKGRGD